MSTQLIAPTFLFHFSVPCRYSNAKWAARGIELGDEFLLPNFAELEDAPKRVAVRAAWNEHGLFFTVVVTGKKQAPWCRENRLDDSDGVFIWIDTRDVHNIHRAGRFCHQLVFLPAGGHRGDEPVAEFLTINRARENPKPVPPGLLQIVRHKQADGYRLDLLVPAAALTGFDPAEHPRLGFHWAVIDREIGEQTFCCPPGLPYREDPSLWGTLELAK